MVLSCQSFPVVLVPFLRSRTWRGWTSKPDQCSQVNCVSFSTLTVKSLPLSPLEAQPSVAVGGAGERQALELRVRAVEEENRALRRELSRPPRNPSGRLHIDSRGNQNRTHSEEGTGDNEGQKNSSDCIQRPVVDKCEVRRCHSHLTLCSEI